MTRSRTAAVFGVYALSGAAAVWLNSLAHPPITDASSTPGLLEWVSSLAATARPAVPLAAIFTIWDRIAVAAAAALSAVAVFRLTQSLTAAAAIGATAAASHLLLPTLAPPDVIALAVAAATACGILGGSTIGTIIGLAIMGAIAPPLVLPSAILCWWLTRRAGTAHPRRALAAAALLVAADCASVLALPALPGETATAALGAGLRWPNDVSGAFRLVAGAVSDAGPLALALAALGAFTIALGDRTAVAPNHRRLAVTLGLPAAACAAALTPGAELIRTLSPLIVGLWLLVGAGIAAISRSGGVRARAAGVAIAAILAAVQLAPRINPPPSAAERIAPLGHERLTRRNFQELLYQLPTNSALVADDAITTILLRSLSGTLGRSRKSLRIVSRSADDVAAAKRVSRVFALPRAQLELPERGVRFADNSAVPIPGLAEVDAVVPCGLLSTGWQTMSSAAGATRLAFVAANNEARGPIVVYSGGPTAIDATATGWPTLALRGFYTRSYDRAQPERKQGLIDEVANDEAPPAATALNTAFVARTELWRVPGAPRMLTIALSSAPAAVVATQLARGTGPIQLCPVFPFAVRAFK